MDRDARSADQKMTDRAKMFLDGWLAKRAQPIPFSEQKRVAKDSYIPVLIHTAAALGITRRELEAAAGGKLLAYVENAIEDKCDAKIRATRSQGAIAPRYR